MNKGKRLDAVLLALGWREEGSLLPLRYKEPDLVRYTVPGRSNGTDSWSVPRHSLVPPDEVPPGSTSANDSQGASRGQKRGRFPRCGCALLF